MILDCMKEWYEEHVAKPARQAELSRRKRQDLWVALKADEGERVKLTDLDRQAFTALHSVYTHPASYESRFLGRVGKETHLTINQRRYLWQMVERGSRRECFVAPSRPHPVLRVWRLRKREILRLHRDGIDWRPETAMPEDYYA